MDPSMYRPDCESLDYYEKVSKGLIEERPYDYWGQDTVEEKAHWEQWWLLIKKSFHPMNWDSEFTGRGILKHQEKTIEKPGLIGPMNEMLVMDVDPFSKAIVYKVDYSSSLKAEVGRGLKQRTRSSLEAAGKIYKQAKEHLVSVVELHRTTSMRTVPFPERCRKLAFDGRK